MKHDLIDILKDKYRINKGQTGTKVKVTCSFLPFALDLNSFMS